MGNYKTANLDPEELQRRDNVDMINMIWKTLERRVLQEVKQAHDAWFAEGLAAGNIRKLDLTEQDVYVRLRAALGSPTVKGALE